MKGFKRQNQLFSLCGLNCGLCPMFLNKNCPGCGGGEGNQACKIARCSIEHGGVEYCFQCSEYPCERYDHIDDFDSFITHRRRKADLEKARQSGVEAYTPLKNTIILTTSIPLLGTASKRLIWKGQDTEHAPVRL